MRVRADVRSGPAYPAWLSRAAAISSYCAVVVTLAVLTVGAFDAIAAMVSGRAESVQVNATPLPVLEPAAATTAEAPVTQVILADEWNRGQRYRSRSPEYRRPSEYRRTERPDWGQRSYLARRPERSGGFFGLFDWNDEPDEAPPPRVTLRTYRTVCVRLCDGFYFPISYATTSDRLGRDEAACQSSCGSEARLFYYRNPGEQPEQMVDLTGQAYSRLKTAFLYRTTYNDSCKCRPHAWEQVSLDRHKLYSLEQRRQKGDRTVAQEIEALKMRQRQAALDARADSRKVADAKRTTRPAATRTAAVEATVAAGASPAPEPRSELRPDAAKAGVPAVETSPGVDGTLEPKVPPPVAKKAKGVRQDRPKPERQAASRPPAASPLEWRRMFDR